MGVTEYNKLYNGCLPTVTSLRPTLQSGEIPTMHTMPTIPTIHMWLGKCQAMPTHVVKNISLFICFFSPERYNAVIDCVHTLNETVFFLFLFSKYNAAHVAGKGKVQASNSQSYEFYFFPKIGGKAQVHLKRVVFVHSAVNCELCKGFNL